MMRAGGEGLYMAASLSGVPVVSQYQLTEDVRVVLTASLPRHHTTTLTLALTTLSH